MASEIQRRTIRVRLTLPDTSITVAGLSVDLFAHMTGMSIDTLLSSLLYAPVERELLPVRCVTYPVEIPEGEGAALPVGSYGELGFLNNQGRLLLTVPRLVWPGVRDAFGDAVESAREIGSPPSVQARIFLRPGMKRRANIGTFGVIGIESV
jgi:hypothetical protein